MWEEFKLGDKVQITAKTGPYSKKLYISRIGDILGPKTLLLYTPISGGSYIHLPDGEEYVFIFYSANGLFQATGTILKHCVQNDLDFMKAEIFEFHRIQRRNFFRLKWLLDFTFSRKSDISDNADAPKAPVYKGVTKDFGGGGLCFVSDIMLLLNEHIMFYFTLDDKDASIEGRVKSRESLENKEKEYEYRIEFINIEGAMQEQIVQYVFKIQWDMIKKKKAEELKLEG